MRPILVLGPPRSGSTWVAEIMASAPGTHHLHEPDSDPNQPFGLLAKAGIGRYPLLGPGDGADRYEQLWTAALTPGSGREQTSRIGRALLKRTSLDLRNEILFGVPTRRARLAERALAAFARPVSPPVGDHTVVKSVHSGLAAGFVTALADPIVVLVRRNPLNAVASWLDLGWRPQHLGATADEERAVGELVGANRPADGAPIEEQHAWSFTALTRALDLEADRTGTWNVVQHEDLCRDPAGGFRELFERTGLPWTRATEDALASRNDRSTGYETKRIAAEEPDRWRDRLDHDDAATIRRTAERLGVEC